MGSSRTFRLAAKYTLTAGLFAFGLCDPFSLWNFTPDPTWNSCYWAGVALLIALLQFGGDWKTFVAHLRFPSRVKGMLPGIGKDRTAMYQAVMTMHRKREERTLVLLEQVRESTNPQVKTMARWLRALAGARWMMRHQRLLPAHRERFPQTMALLFSNGRQPIRRQQLSRELAAITSEELDILARGYIDLVDVLIQALGSPKSPFHAQAEEVLEYVTGKSFVVGSRERFEGWWHPLKPVYQRGAGALLAGLRLLQRDHFGEAASLLERLGSGGMLSSETETLRRTATYFSLITRPQWRLTGPDIPRFFRDLHYLGCIEMGVLRYPAAEMPEVVQCCQRGRDLSASKVGFIEDLFSLWNAFGSELATPLAALLKKLLDHRVRPCPTRMEYWRRVWLSKAKDFEEPVMLLMEGIAATAEGHLAAAGLLFERAGKLDPGISSALVNLVYLRLAAGKEDEARKLAAEAVQRFPKDAGAFISLGCLFAMHLENTSEAELLFLRARELDKTAIEPLIRLGEVKLLQGKYNLSQDYFDQARKIDEHSPEAKLGLARIYIETQRFELAVPNLRSVARDGGGDVQHLAHYLLYRTYREMGQDQQAIDFLNQVPTPFFKEPDVLDDIAFHLEREKHYAQARVFAERAMLLRTRGKEQSGGGLLSSHEL